jgi:hypothetical protein
MTEDGKHANRYLHRRNALRRWRQHIDRLERVLGQCWMALENSELSETSKARLKWDIRVAMDRSQMGDGWCDSR